MKNTQQTKTYNPHLRLKVAGACLALIIAFIAVSAATFAWYIYNTSVHTQSVQLAASSGGGLKISLDYVDNQDEIESIYRSSVSFPQANVTLNPVSSERIIDETGKVMFQKVFGFTNGSENQTNLVATIFGESTSADYHVVPLYIRSNMEEAVEIYLSGISFEDSEAAAPISTALRVGFVVHEPGKNKPAIYSKQYVYTLNPGSNPNKLYNTKYGVEGYVLDSKKDDGSVVKLAETTDASGKKTHEVIYSSDSANPVFEERYVYTLTSVTADQISVDNNITEVEFSEQTAIPLFELQGNNGKYSEAVQVDVYFWLEGCDEDCYNNLMGKEMKSISVTFSQRIKG